MDQQPENNNWLQNFISNPNLIPGLALMLGGVLTAFTGLGNLITFLLLLVGLFGIHRLQVGKDRKVSTIGLLITTIGFLLIGITRLVIQSSVTIPSSPIDAYQFRLILVFLSLFILGVGFLVFGTAMYRSRTSSVFISYMPLFGLLIAVISPIVLGLSFLLYGVLLLKNKFGGNQDNQVTEIKGKGVSSDYLLGLIFWSISNLIGSFLGFIPGVNMLGLLDINPSYDPFVLCILWPIGLPFGIVLGALTFWAFSKRMNKIIAVFASIIISVISGYISSNITLIFGLQM